MSIRASPAPRRWPIYWLPLRAGSDIVFLGALIHYVLENERYFRDYVVHYTNAATILREDFRDTEDLARLVLRLGCGEEEVRPGDVAVRRSRSRRTGDRAGHHRSRRRPRQGSRRRSAATPHDIVTDETLQHPRCVFQVLKRHFARYTPEMVEQDCGIPQKRLPRSRRGVYRRVRAGEDRRICYAVGWTQHSTGVQIIRAAAILQLLLGNIGRPGGGILALRGHASIQGSTDIPTLYDILPGYLPMPFFEDDANVAGEVHSRSTATHAGLWSQLRQVHRQPAKAWYGDAATKENEFGFDWLPRLTGDHSHFGYWLDMADGKLEGLFVMGQNPAVGAPNGRLERKALAKLKWLVVRDLVEIETATFWHDSPEVERGELQPRRSARRSFCFPPRGTRKRAAPSPTRSGCCSGTRRRSIRRATRAARPGSSITSGGC